MRPVPVLLFVILATLAIASPRPFLLAFVFAYPAAAFIRVTRQNLGVSLPAIGLANVGAVIVLGGILRIAGVPLSCCNTYLARYAARPSPQRLTKKLNNICHLPSG